MAEIVAGEDVGQPDQIHVPDEAESGFASETFTSTMICRQKIIYEKDKPKVYGIFYQDPRLKIGETAILDKTKDAKAWYPIMANVELVDMQCTQVEKGVGVEIGREVKDISICVYDPDDHRSILTPTYSLHECKNPVGKDLRGNEYERYKKARENADLGQYTNDVLSLIDITNFTAGRYAKNNGPELLFEECSWNFTDHDWKEHFNRDTILEFGMAQRRTNIT